MTTEMEVAEILSLVSGAITNAPQLKANNFEAYHLVLKDLPADVLRAAALEYIKDATFFPSAGELRKAAMRLMERAQGIPSAQDAWAEVCKSFGSHGYYRGAPDWSHPLIGKAVAGIGGYAALCISENPPADRARFLQAYDSYLERERDDAAMLPEVRDVVRQLAGTMRPALTEGF